MNSIIETLKHLGPARLGIMAGVLIGLMLFFVFLTVRVSQPDMQLLYGDLSTSDTSTIAGVLENAGIRYSVSDDSTQVRVPDDQIGRARMLLAQEGLPNGGSIGYELFDEQTGFGTTNFVQNINQVRAIEGELSRTIGSIDAVRSARVHLVLPRRELFSRDNRQATASVLITQNRGNRLKSEQILSIQHLVASAVPELTPDNVSVVDSNGALLARGGDSDEALLSAKSEERRRNYERRMTQAIEDIVGRVVGFGSVRANVTADLNFDRITTSEEIYDPASQVVRSSQVVEERESEQETANSPTLPGAGGDLLSAGSGSNQENSRLEEVTNFEISRTERNMVREVGEVSKLSVAVLVDGNYSKDEEGEQVYTPRTEEELALIEDLVKSAIGFDDERGDTLRVVNMKFAPLDVEKGSFTEDLLLGFERSEFLDALEIVAVALMIILVIVLIVQPMVGRLLAEASNISKDAEADLLTSGQGSGSPAALAAPETARFGPTPVEMEEEEEDSSIDIQQVKGKVKASALKKVEDIVDNYPNETVSVIRSWMSQE